jgi:hypothetical protein
MPPTIVQLAASSAMMNGFDAVDVDMDYQDSFFTGEDTFLPQHRAALPDLAAKIGSKVRKFLNLRPKNDQIKAVQEQTRASLKVITEALDRYE